MRVGRRCRTPARLVKVNRDGTFTVVTDGLNQPTSLEFIGNTAYVVSLAGTVWKIEGIADDSDAHGDHGDHGNHGEHG